MIDLSQFDGLSDEASVSSIMTLIFLVWQAGKHSGSIEHGVLESPPF